MVGQGEWQGETRTLDQARADPRAAGFSASLEDQMIGRPVTGLASVLSKTTPGKTTPGKPTTFQPSAASC